MGYHTHGTPGSLCCVLRRGAENPASLYSRRRRAGLARGWDERWAAQGSVHRQTTYGCDAAAHGCLREGIWCASTCVCYAEAARQECGMDFGEGDVFVYS